MLLKQEGRSHRQVTRTINPSTMLSLPEGGTYIIEVRALSEGGEGAVSSQVRLVTSSGKTPSAPPNPPPQTHTRTHTTSGIQPLCAGCSSVIKSVQLLHELSFLWLILF